MRTTRILERMGFQIASPFSSVHEYSQIPQPVHLLGSTETNFLCSDLADCILVTKPFWCLDICVHNWLLTVTYQKHFFDGKTIEQKGNSLF
jgi:hypothetical protein